MNLIRKARLVDGGHLHKNVPKYTTYSNMISREMVLECALL